MSIADPIIRLVRKSFLGAVGVLVIDNQLAKLKLARGDIENEVGATHAARSVEECIAYIRGVFEAYRTHLGTDHLHGRIAEIGPGDNCGTALLMLADGAEHVDLVDRFYSSRNASQQSAIYSALIAQTPNLAHLSGLDTEDRFPGIARRYGEAAAAERFFPENRDYDAIVSCAVMEHLTDPVSALHRMQSALKPGGVMAHIVDLRDHSMFTAHGFHELKLLEVPDGIYREMTQARGRPNRVPLSRYREALPAADIKVVELVSAGALPEPLPYGDIPYELREQAEAEVKRHRHRFQRRFQEERIEDLAVAGFVLRSVA